MRTGVLVSRITIHETAVIFFVRIRPPRTQINGTNFFTGSLGSLWPPSKHNLVDRKGPSLGNIQGTPSPVPRFSADHKMFNFLSADEFASY